MRDREGQSGLRAWGYRLLPASSFDYVLHLRPREWPIVAAHLLFGFFLAGAGADAGIAALGIFLFVIPLNGGTLAINSAFDRDAGDIGYLDAPPPPPRGLFTFGMALMVAGQIVSVLWLPPGFSAVYFACLAMSVLYSVPPFRWKAVAGLDLVINAIGFGVLTPLAGWTLARAPLGPAALLVLLGFGPLFAALYPLTQLYQFEEDRSRGDRTLALVLGMHNALRFAVGMAVLAFAMMGVGVGLHSGFAGMLLVAIPGALWLLLLLRWLRDHPTMSDAEHKRGMYRALTAWAVTDALVLAGWLVSFL